MGWIGSRQIRNRKSWKNGFVDHCEHRNRHGRIDENWFTLVGFRLIRSSRGLYRAADHQVIGDECSRKDSVLFSAVKKRESIAKVPCFIDLSEQNIE